MQFETLNQKSDVDFWLRASILSERAVHNLLAGTHREQRRFLNDLRYNELEASLVCFGVSEAVDAIRSDAQLAQRLDEHHLPNWRNDAEFSDMIQTLIAAMPLAKKSNLKIPSISGSKQAQPKRSPWPRALLPNLSSP